MYPQLMAMASRLGPQLSRIVKSHPFGAMGAAGVGAGLKMPTMPEVPEATSVSPPISSDNSGTPGVPSTPSRLPSPPIGGAFNPLSPVATYPHPGAAEASSLDDAQWPQGPEGGPSSLDTAQWPAGPVGAPRGALSSAMAQAQEAQPEPMGFFDRNTAMMRDPGTGDFIDPGAASRAATGPDLIQNVMNYLHRKRSA